MGAGGQEVPAHLHTWVQLVDGGVSIRLLFSLVSLGTGSLQMWHLNTCLYAFRKFSERKAYMMGFTEELLYARQWAVILKKKEAWVNGNTPNSAQRWTT